MIYAITFNVDPLFIKYLVVSDSITIQPSDGFPEHPPQWIKNPDLPHILLDDDGYKSYELIQLLNVYIFPNVYVP